MRSSLFSKGRQIGGGLCDACKQQAHRQRRSLSSIATTSPLRAATIPTLGSAPTPSTSSSKYQPTARRSPFSTSRTLRTPEPAADAQQEDTKSASSPATPQTHYDFFPQTLPTGPPPAGPFSIDVRALRREFLALQGQAHPDLHPPAMKSRAEATSARINEAFRTLANPLARAQYLLQLQHGLDVAADETAKVEDPELLMEVLEAREQIEEAQDEAELAPLREANAERENESVALLEDAFAKADLEAAVRECVKLRYWVNIRESIDNWERGKPVVLEH
ncbi:Fe-S protein assembly co-chaperone HscB [Pestalotiopsis sp. NC0098]|nr:Fe-S protein assembly co-chaperone HscB [Pestalotiopsis sp. NC0098]